MSASQCETTDVDRQSFRDAMARLSAAVHVISSEGPAGRIGFTASAVCSVSDSPPTLVVCMNRNSQQNEPLRRNGVFCVNSLSGEQQRLSGIFAGFDGLSMEDRFSQDGWSRMSTGSPVLDGALVSFDCRISSTIEIATHTLLIGEVVGIRRRPEPASALIYFERRYHAVPCIDFGSQTRPLKSG